MDRLVLTDYTIFVGTCLAPLQEFLEKGRYSGVFVLADENTIQHCWPRIQPLGGLDQAQIIEIPSGERYKNLETCSRIWQALLHAGADRKALLINLGGGVIGDMGGFCASAYKRGIDFIQIPTTLLSQVDASVGGKLGIDFQNVKNSIGVFANPRAVFIDPDFLATLPARELRSGFAEIIKHALIADAGQWEAIKKITRLEKIHWKAYILPSLHIKKQVVEADPFEQGLRKTLNFGHTIGHAFEAVSLTQEHPLLHGEAVAAGMICEAFLSFQEGFLDENELNEISRYLIELYQPAPLDQQHFQMYLDLMRNDKKNEGGGINFSLIGPAGTAHINQTMDQKTIEASFSFFNGQLGT